ncbi:hypothetical protein [Henriciella mobilis]|uniref:hypothetical protein n=1 Tax=Henriciella mobilis TaxID=2305467 RepID=UPI001F1B0861|nr:hypothetical protein [Henriciella mobilis]
MKLTAIALAGLCLAATACTSGPQRANTGGAANFKVTPQLRAELEQQGLDPDERVCRTEDQIGSIIPKRICATRAAWYAKTKASQEGTAEIQRDALQTRAPGSGG